MKLIRLCSVVFVIPLLLAAGCSKKSSDTSAAVTPAKHEHHPPHGGTPVVLGNEAYHLELVLDPAAGKLQAFILDGEMENFIRSAAPSFEVLANVAGKSEPLLFVAIADSATGEKIGDTALFEATAPWLKTVRTFDGILTKLEIRGTVFAGVAFNFPKGNDRD